MDLNNIELIDDIIRRSTTGNVTSEEMTLLNVWLSNSKENKDYYIKAKAIDTLCMIDDKIRNNDINDNSDTNINKAIKYSILNKIKEKKKRRKLKMINYIAASVASIAIILSVLIIYNDNNSNLTAKIFEQKNNDIILKFNGKVIDLKSKHSGTDSTLSKIGVANYNSKVKQITISKPINKPNDDIKKKTNTISNNIVSLSVQNGNRYLVTLPDSTKVWLNSGSELSFDNEFSSRDVTLKGEGYFDVTKDVAHPFRVHLENDKTVTVLGTIFNIKAYSKADKTYISLLEGSVKVNSKNSDVTLTPNNQAIVNDNGDITTSKFDSRHIVAWINGGLAYEEELFEDVIKDLSRRFNIKFEIKDDSLKMESITMILDDCNLDMVLKHLKKAGEGVFTIKLSGAAIIIDSVDSK